MPLSTRRIGLRDLLTLGLAVAGIAVAAYLTVIHYDDRLLLCGAGDCHTVQQSKYAELGGIPVAILGLAMYLAILGLGASRVLRPEIRFWATALACAIALSGFLYAAYLTYVELWVIDAICQWCVLSAAITTAILILETIAVWRSLEE
jgi:uncharacterized membrane protein